MVSEAGWSAEDNSTAFVSAGFTTGPTLGWARWRAADTFEFLMSGRGEAFSPVGLVPDAANAFLIVPLLSSDFARSRGGSSCTHFGTFTPKPRFGNHCHFSRQPLADRPAQSKKAAIPPAV